MFRCFITKKLSKSGEKPIKVVIERRERIYTRKFRDEDGELVEEMVGRGWEIVKEVMMTKEGYDRYLASLPAGQAHASV